MGLKATVTENERQVLPPYLSGDIFCHVRQGWDVTFSSHLVEV